MPSAGRASLDQDALGLLRRTMGSEAEFRSMLEEFLVASKRVWGDLDAAARNGRNQDAERAAHTLKSMARMVGAFALADSCADAEALAVREPLPAGTVRTIEARLDAAQDAVQTCLG
ncbi:MAG: Hpt domain-containing protein [Thermoplasmatota archaeon]